MVVNAALASAALRATALGATALGATALGAAGLVVCAFTVGFSFGFRAAFTALLVIFIFSVSHSINRRRTGPPPRSSRKQTSFHTTAAGH
jgi:hypothetical protein